MYTESKNKKKVNLRKSAEQLKTRHKRLLQSKKKTVVSIILLAIMFLFVFVSIVLIITGNSFSEYNVFFDYIFKLICLMLNAL